MDPVGTAEQQPAVPGSVGLQSADQLLVDHGAPELQDRLRVPGDQHADRRLQPEVRPRHLRRAVHPAGERGRRSGDLQPRGLHARPAQLVLDHHAVPRQPAAADALRLPPGRHQGEREADAERRPALRVRDAAVREGQLPHQLRSDDQHADRREGRIDLRPRAGQSRSQQLRAAARRGLGGGRRRRSSAPATA